jgi:hypothetical protein
VATSQPITEAMTAMGMVSAAAERGQQGVGKLDWRQRVQSDPGHPGLSPTAR